jgi:uncharacterized repeat protein (TIGR03806 family)
LQLEGEVRAIDFVDEDGVVRHATYLVPQKNQCFECHERKDETGRRVFLPIGPRPRYLNRETQWRDAPINQLKLLADEGLLAESGDQAPAEPATDLPGYFALEHPTAGQTERAARDYLDMNCAHCHRPTGLSGLSSQLFLNVENEDLFHLGVCKRPGSAGQGTGGLSFDIVPGDPSSSILHFRVATEEVGAMMPMIGRSLAHKQGADLVRDWIALMVSVDCET